MNEKEMTGYSNPRNTKYLFFLYIPSGIELLLTLQQPHSQNLTPTPSNITILVKNKKALKIRAFVFP